MSSRIKSFSIGLPSILFAASLCLYCYRIAEPPLPYFDEHYFVPTARALYRGEGIGEFTHPPLGKLMMVFFIWLWGDEPTSWRIGSAICGALSVTYVFRLTLLISGQLSAALLAAILFLSDGLAFTQARIGLLNSPALMLSLAAFYAAYEGSLKLRVGYKANSSNVTTPLAPVKTTTIQFALVGALFGLAISAKWSAAALLPIVVGLLCVQPRLGAWRFTLNRATITAFCALIVFALCFYLLPFVALEPFFGTFSGGFIKYNSLAFKHHTIDAVSEFRYSSPWWSWPLLLRPIWYGFQRLSDGSGLLHGILCIGNPVVFLAILSAVVLSTISLAMRLCGRWRHVWSYASDGSLLMLACYLINWLPWALAERMTMFHYLYPAIPFGCILSALTLSNMVPRKGRTTIFIILLIASVAMFAIWYPLWSALPISEQRWKMLMWSKGWL